MIRIEDFNILVDLWLNDSFYFVWGDILKGSLELKWNKLFFGKKKINVCLNINEGE